MVDPVTHQIRDPMSDRIPGTNDTASDDKAFLRRRMRTLRREHVEALPRSVLALMFSRPPGPVAERVPEDPAAEGWREMTYGDGLERVRRLAQAFIEAGAGPTQVSPAASTARAKSAFSERKP